jgi:hypothetical protein
MGAVLHDGLDYVARTRSLGPALAPAADEIERNRELPKTIVSAMIEHGLFRLLQSRSLGGAELDPNRPRYTPDSTAERPGSAASFIRGSHPRMRRVSC